MQDNYVYMQDNYECNKNLCSDVPSGPPYVSGDYFKMQFDLSERIG